MTNTELLNLKQEIDNIESYDEFAKRTGFKRRNVRADQEGHLTFSRLVSKIDLLETKNKISVQVHSFLIDRLFNRYYGYAE